MRRIRCFLPSCLRPTFGVYRSNRFTIFFFFWWGLIQGRVSWLFDPVLVRPDDHRRPQAPDGSERRSRPAAARAETRGRRRAVRVWARRRQVSVRRARGTRWRHFF